MNEDVSVSKAETENSFVKPSCSYSSDSVLLKDNENISWFTWVPTSMNQLENAERRLFQTLKNIRLEGRYIQAKLKQSQLWTVTAEWRDIEKKNSSVPLVLVHGFGGGVGLWAQNLDGLTENRTVHAFDLLGFGRSSRIKFSTDPTLLEAEWVSSIENWRIGMGIDKMVLLGHSLGGYLASAYSIEHPESVRHLILVDPWGFPARPPEGEVEVSLPTWVKTLGKILSFFNPLSSIRAAGPWGKYLVRRFRPDLGRKFGGGEDGDEEAFYDYIYHCNAQTPSGEIAFKNMSIPFGWSKKPMIERLPKLRSDVPITFIYGSRSWIDSGPGYEMQHQFRTGSFVDVQIIRGAGHHVYADRPEDFNRAVLDVCEKVDLNVDIPSDL